MEVLFWFLFVFGLMGAALWFVSRYLLPHLARREQEQHRFKRSNHDCGGSDEPGDWHSRSHDSDGGGTDGGGGDGGD